ncbi:MAG: DUF2141 domain-containing protein [Bacteroidales bacterium]
MIKVFLQFFALFLLSVYPSPQITLNIEITNLRNDKGFIMLQLFNESEVVIRQEMGTIKEKKSNIVFKELNAGRYGIRFFHDENMNGTLETNKMGIPTEGYGFSNNAYGMFGPRPFKDWLFELKGDERIVLKTKY